ncbi:hypothetical protein D3C87_1474160 [compost metagenome]
MTLSTNNFESLDFIKLMNIYNVWGKYFAGLVIYKGAEIQAKSEKLNGLYEFGEVVNYIRKGKDVSLEIEFCGDNGIWNEVVKVEDCKTFNKF